MRELNGVGYECLLNQRNKKCGCELTNLVCGKNGLRNMGISERKRRGKEEGEAICQDLMELAPEEKVLELVED